MYNDLLKKIQSLKSFDTIEEDNFQTIHETIDYLERSLNRAKIKDLSKDELELYVFTVNTPFEETDNLISLPEPFLDRVKEIQEEILATYS
ncbi:hypothetical protein CWB76_11410 [Pseudoalteromonas sp. S1609]|uniref:hypothetical protein n=1 Tax=Pseudoalteromonas sp. S1609 TaxID=579505 RepID=UPI00110C0F05|nr:hypothetical protein [Pseudoalteromonas sp. S1609]TMP70229.1 hypothetical protein CWB76_11410 [Pseudoalteromonas sp. S1609]